MTTLVTLVMDGSLWITLVTLVTAGVPSMTLVTFVMVGWPSMTLVNLVMVGWPSMSRVTLVTSGTVKGKKTCFTASKSGRAQHYPSMQTAFHVIAGNITNGPFPGSERLLCQKNVIHKIKGFLLVSKYYFAIFQLWILFFNFFGRDRIWLTPLVMSNPSCVHVCEELSGLTKRWLICIVSQQPPYFYELFLFTKYHLSDFAD